MEDDAYYKLWQNTLDLLSNVKPDLVLYDAALTPCGRSLGEISPTDTGIFAGNAGFEYLCE